MTESKGFLRVRQIIKILSIGKSTWWLWVRTGKAPAGIRLGEKTTVWKIEDVQQFIDNAGKVEAAKA